MKERERLLPVNGNIIVFVIPNSNRSRIASADINLWAREVVHNQFVDGPVTQLVKRFHLQLQNRFIFIFI